MKITKLTNQSLLDLHQLIQECLFSDDSSENNAKPYGVRDYPDWRRQSDEFEGEMIKRGIKFEKINWQGIFLNKFNFFKIKLFIYI